MKDDRLYLIHIRECIDWIEKYTVDGRANFLEDRKTQDAVLRNLHTLAESTQRVSETLKQKQPEVAWRTIASFRNVIVHDYLGVSFTQVWDIVEQDLPVLKSQIESILNETK